MTTTISLCNKKKAPQMANYFIPHATTFRKIHGCVIMYNNEYTPYNRVYNTYFK